MLYMPAGVPFDFDEVVGMMQKLHQPNGMGIYFLSDHQLYKGLKYTESKLLNEGDWKEGFLFHTRLATLNPINNVNCQPFIIGDDLVFANHSNFNSHGLISPLYPEATSTNESEYLGWWLKQVKFQTYPENTGDYIALYKGKLLLHGVDLVTHHKEGYSWIQCKL